MNGETHIEKACIFCSLRIFHCDERLCENLLDTTPTVGIINENFGSEDGFALCEHVRMKGRGFSWVWKIATESDMTDMCVVAEASMPVQ